MISPVDLPLARLKPGESGFSGHWRVFLEPEFAHENQRVTQMEVGWSSQLSQKSGEDAVA